MTEEDYEDGNEELVDMSRYNLDEPIEYDHSIKPFVPAKAMIKRSCYNTDCNWEGMLEEWVRFCPICEYEIKGWKSRYET